MAKGGIASATLLLKFLASLCVQGKTCALHPFPPSSIVVITWLPTMLHRLTKEMFADDLHFRVGFFIMFYLLCISLFFCLLLHPTGHVSTRWVLFSI